MKNLNYRMITLVGVVILVLAFASTQQRAALQSGDTLYYMSYATATWQDLLRNELENLEEIRIAAKIHLPQKQSQPLPLMIIMHGSGGMIHGREDFYAQQLNAQGIAALLVDSFTPRGLDSIQGQQELVQTPTMMVDLYRALEKVQDIPQIDSQRIGAMGFSKGGAAAIFIADKRFHQILAPTAQPFTLGVAFYPPCIATLDNPMPNSSKVFILAGSKDTLTPAVQCEHQAETMRQAGADVQVIQYPGAYHGWDLPFPLEYNHRDYSYNDCQVSIEDDGTLIDRKLASVITSNEDLKSSIRHCGTPGIWTGSTSKNIAEKSLRDLKKILAQHL